MTHHNKHESKRLKKDSSIIMRDEDKKKLNTDSSATLAILHQIEALNPVKKRVVQQPPAMRSAEFTKASPSVTYQ